MEISEIIWGKKIGGGRERKRQREREREERKKGGKEQTKKEKEKENGKNECELKGVSLERQLEGFTPALRVWLVNWWVSVACT